MAHPRARLNAYGRELLVTRVVANGWPVATASQAMGVSRATGHKWVRRYRAEGSSALPIARPGRITRPDQLQSPKWSASSPLVANDAGDPIGWAHCWAIRPRRSPPCCAARDAKAGRPRPPDRAPVALRGVPPGRAAPPGPQEAGTDPGWRRPSAAGRSTETPRRVASATTTSRWSSTTAAGRACGPGPGRECRQCGGSARARAVHVRRGRHRRRARHDRGTRCWAAPSCGIGNPAN